MNEFEMKLNQCKDAVERFVYYRISHLEDAKDILQDVYFQAYKHFDSLENKDLFKHWILQIARNQCYDYYRKRAKRNETSIDHISEMVFSENRLGKISPVQCTLEKLNASEQQIIQLFYYEGLSQNEIARTLQIPLGTVKSRLSNAKVHFKENFIEKGDELMKLPEFLPDYQIKLSSLLPFEVEWQELFSWFIIPRLNEKILWAIYDSPSHRCDFVYEMEVTGKAEVHGIEGVEINVKEYPYNKKKQMIEHQFIAQLTNDYTRFLSVIRKENNIKKVYTFLDDDYFTQNWGFGKDNCGKENHLKCRNKIHRNEKTITFEKEPNLMDIAGRFDITINHQTFDTVCVIDASMIDDGIILEYYLDQKGRTIIERRFNKYNWRNENWAEKLPHNERILVNGELFIHWYDSFSDYIL